MKSAWIALVILLSICATRIRADEVTLESVPPVVVKTVPEAGGNDVDPKLTEIKVTFSKDMAGWKLVVVYAVAGKLSRNERQAKILGRQTD